MLFELTKLSVPPLKLDTVSAGARKWLQEPEARGKLAGFWRSEIGELFQLFILRAFDTAAELSEEQRRVRLSSAPFAISDTEIKISMEGYQPFPFLPLPALPVDEADRFYEFRTYLLKPGGLNPTLAAWEKAVPLAHDYTSHLVTNMYALDGPPRITHIWKFSNLEERARLRSEHYAAGLWPPEGGPQQIASAISTICLVEKLPRS